MKTIQELSSVHASLLSLIQTQITKERYQHSLRVAELAYALARAHHADEQAAWAAGVSHDVCREWNETELVRYAVKAAQHDILGTDAHIYLEAAELKRVHGSYSYLEHVPVTKNGVTHAILLHGIAATAYLAQHYPLSQEIYRAIAAHTLGCPNPTLLQKIVYVSDFLEPERNILQKNDIKKLLMLSLNKQILAVIDTLHALYHSTHWITMEMKVRVTEELYEK